MNSRGVRVIGAVLASCGAVAGSAAANVTFGPGATMLPRPAALVARGQMRTVQAGSHRTFSVPTATGCTVNGANDFLGLSNTGNLAGGSASSSGKGYSGVAAGGSNQACDFYSFIGAGANNIIGGDNYGVNSSIVSGLNNQIFDSYNAFIGGGEANIISTTPNDEGYASGIVAGAGNTVAVYTSFIVAGLQNSILGLSGEYANDTIAAGLNNLINGSNSSIGSGQGNTIEQSFAAFGSGYQNTVSGEYGSIGSGYENTVSANYGNVGGGNKNSATNLAATIAGGTDNTASGRSSTVAGGYNNTASADSSTIPGGVSNVARGIDSFAAGTGSHANTTGAFVWSDDSAGATVLESSAPDQFLARAAGGFYLYSSATLASGVSLAPGSGAWSTLSDRNAKTDIQSVDDERILAKIASMPVSEWSYAAQGTAVRHVGPMAQDFRAAFGLGEDERHISTVDEEGVALAAIKALQRASLAKDQAIAQLRADKDRQIADLRAEKDREIADLRNTEEVRFAAMERRMAVLESRN